MKKIIFRADGNSTTGLGHLYRIFALIEIYKNDFECLLLTSENTATAVIPKAYHFKTIPADVTIEREPLWISDNYSSTNTWIIADGYHFTPAYQKAIKALNYSLAYVDDLCAGHMYADVVINHSMVVQAADYKAESYTRFALGTEFAILRPLFLEAAGTSRSIYKTATAFVCFGGADPLNLTLKAVQALTELPAIEKINVVVGGAYRHSAIFELEKTQPAIKVHQNISEAELIDVMKACDFAIAPASNILYEVCAVKMPVLSGYYVENQKNIYNGAIEKQIIFDGGNFEAYTVADFKNKITALMAENNPKKYTDAQSKLFDGKTRERFLNLLMNISYRKATAADLLLVFNWANDPLSRANSYFSEPIALETHTAWFEKKLADKNAVIWIAEVDGQPAGMVRYEAADEQAVVGILVGDNFRGKGLAAQFLKDTAGLYFNSFAKPVNAYIKKDNLASVRSFEKAGYTFLRQEAVHGHASFVYQLKNINIKNSAQ